MHAERWQRVKELFRTALDQSPDERDAFLASNCRDDALRAEVARLLELHNDPSEFLNTPIESSADPWMGRNLAGFKIVRRIGAGGMGAVYEAEQEHPRRKAAIKVLQPGFATRAVMRRFEYESEILAKLQHPGIAHVYAAGTFDLGNGPQPWFAMELIDGEPLHKFVKHEAFLTKRKLELLLLVCDAAQHAHLRGVVHRDLKPANILVDRTGQPKVLDFGVARSLDMDAQATMHTTAGEILGTLSYMSPEQLSAGEQEIDARCDVYALGVIGYELLGGRLPHQPRSSAVTELIRAIEQDEPARLGLIAPSLRGDVETIFDKALEKDVARRYQSAAELAADIRRYLNDEPVLARPASAMYHFGKFARRNRAVVGGVSATILALAIGLIMYGTQARHARLEAERSRYEADKATAINNFITNDCLMKLIAAVNTRQGEGLEVADLLDQATTNVNIMFADQPLAEAAVRNEIATIYYNVGAFDRAAKQFQIAMDRWQAQLGPDHVDTLKAVNNLGQTLMRQRKPELAEPLYVRALQGRRRALGDEDPFTLVSMNNLAELYRATNRLDEAEAMLRQTLDTQRRVHGVLHKNTITTMANLGGLLISRGKTDEALSLHRAAYDASRKTLGEQHLTTLTAATRLGQTLHRAGMQDEAAALLSMAADSFERALGAGSADTVTARRALARVYKSQGKPIEAGKELSRALAAAEAEPQKQVELIREIESDLKKLERASPGN
ncbi:hypothetical protein BH09PLA1_BH09PLA1_31270 [soil metagenome]